MMNDYIYLVPNKNRIEKMEKKNRKLKKRNKSLKELCEQSLSLLEDLDLSVQLHTNTDNEEDPNLVITARDSHTKFDLGCNYTFGKGFNFGLHCDSKVSDRKIERG